MTLRSWVLDHWRLKLLALVLSIVLLGTVAFSLNPVQFRTLDVVVGYRGIPDGVVVMSPQSRIPVTIHGLSDAVEQAAGLSAGVTAEIDLSKLAHRHGAGKQVVQATIAFHTTVPGVTVQPNVVTSVTVDDVATATLPIQVETPNIAPGFSVPLGKATSDPAQVTLTGPSSELSNLSAFVTVPFQIDGQLQVPSLPVQFHDSSTGQTVTALAPSLPASSFAPTVVNVSVSALQNQQVKEVALIVSPQGQQACGYEIAGITFSPGGGQVAVTGPPGALAQVGTITLQPVSVDGATGNVTSTQTVPVPAGASSVSPPKVTITFQIQQVFSCSPVPTPAPSPT